MGKYKDLTGQAFGRLTVVRRTNYQSVDRTHWECRCVCGALTSVLASNLTRSHTTSCGCLQAEITTTRSTIHGGATRSHKSPEYKTWASMRARCSPDSKDKVYNKNYSAMGITVDPQWDRFETFLSHMGARPSPTHSIDRIDGTRGYGPDNCRWATKAEQAINRKNVVYVEYEGARHKLHDLATARGLPPSAVWQRIKSHGWDVARALETPIRIRIRK